MVSNVPRSVRIGGRRTSMRLESQFWDALRDVAAREHSDVGEICTRIAKGARYANLSSAVRVAMMDYYRELAARREPPVASQAPSLAGD
jgi:predicted DNA-binding ribbon-helix-helix protein